MPCARTILVFFAPLHPIFTYSSGYDSSDSEAGPDDSIAPTTADHLTHKSHDGTGTVADDEAPLSIRAPEVHQAPVPHEPSSVDLITRMSSSHYVLPEPAAPLAISEQAHARHHQAAVVSHMVLPGDDAAQVEILDVPTGDDDDEAVLPKHEVLALESPSVYLSVPKSTRTRLSYEHMTHADIEIAQSPKHSVVIVTDVPPPLTAHIDTSLETIGEESEDALKAVAVDSDKAGQSRSNSLRSADDAAPTPRSQNAIVTLMESPRAARRVRLADLRKNASPKPQINVQLLRSRYASSADAVCHRIMHIDMCDSLHASRRFQSQPRQIRPSRPPQCPLSQCHRLHLLARCRAESSSAM